MADEAREAAWRVYLERNGWKGDNDAFVSGFDAGVAEGIRQAREAVGGGPRFYALRVIDALAKEADRG